MPSPLQPRHAETVLPCETLGPTLEFFTERLGFSIAGVMPADAPRWAVVVGHGTRIRLVQGLQAAPGRVRLSCEGPRPPGGELRAPNGTIVELAPATPPVVVPPLEPGLVFSAPHDDHDAWVTGRAGMRYRDLLPGRFGGRFIASHIHIEAGGPVPDWVHFHAIAFQMIFCWRGWVRVVYEDQGPAFVMRPGDCVLQPPRIRHRVLECSPGLDVIEVSCPAEHETWADAELALPTPRLDAERDFDGQRFVRHVAADAPWLADEPPGGTRRDTGIETATRGLARVDVRRVPAAGAWTSPATHDELRLSVVLEGAAGLEVNGDTRRDLAPGDAVTLPAGAQARWNVGPQALTRLDVTVPAATPLS